MDRFIDYLRAEVGASDHTIRAYARILGELAAGLGDRPLHEASRLDLRGYLARSGGSAATVAQRISAMRAYFKWATREQLVTEDPSERLTRPKVPVSLPRVLEVNEASNLVENALGEGAVGLRNTAIVELAYSAGLRVAELAGLDVRDISLAQGLVHVRMGKGKKDRRVPMGPPAADAIRAHLGAHRFEDVGSKPATLDERATTVAILAQVGAFPEKLINQVAMGTMQLNGVKTQPFGSTSRAGKGGDGVGNVGVAHRLGNFFDRRR